MTIQAARSGGGNGPVSEAQVVYWLKRALVRRQFFGSSPRDILVDADGAYLNSPFRKQLEPTGSLRIGQWRADLLCLVHSDNVERVVGFEVKAFSDLEKGVIQASRYREGVHESYLCIPQIDHSRLSWLTDSARANEIGLVLASEKGIDIRIRPSPPRPDPRSLLSTRRYLLGEETVRAFGLNKPLHYIAALVAHLDSGAPITSLTGVWGLRESAARHAIRGAEILGLLAHGRPTLKGRAYADAFTALGFSLARDRPLTGVRLVDHHPAYAAVVRAILLDSPPVTLIVQALESVDGGPISADRLAARATAIDEGTARAVFGERPGASEEWQIRSSTRFTLKAALYDAGLISTRLSRGASGSTSGTYRCHQDMWQLRREAWLDRRDSGVSSP